MIGAIVSFAGDRADVATAARVRAEAARKAAADEVVAAAHAETERIMRPATDAVRAHRQPAEADVLALVERAVNLIESLQLPTLQSHDGALSHESG